jgi:hypothetical protein
VINQKGDQTMKRKVYILIILVAFASLPSAALAYERNFPAGSIIIPMDAFYQPDDDGGLFEAYGLVYYLLSHQDQQCLIDAPTEPETLACKTACGGDSDCELACVQEALRSCDHAIGVSWIINDQKASIDGVDLVIEDNTLPREEGGVEIDKVVKLYDHAGGFTDVDFRVDTGDKKTRISYRGSLWVIDVQELDDGVEDELYDLIDSDSWDAVNVHVAQVPFAAPVFRDMRGTPPKIALMNNDEDKTKGNAAILESYLRLAGICSNSYEVVTPNEIAGYAAGDTDTEITPILSARDYDFLWAPHWDAPKNYNGEKGYAHQDEVVSQVQLYLKRGKGLLAECASIETFEHNSHGHFLADKGFGHNGVAKNAANVAYSNVGLAYTQIGDFPGLFGPQGGHLHNWRPYQDGDPYNFDDTPDVSGGNSTYNPTVKQFTSDDSNNSHSVDTGDWDYFVGGYAYGNEDYGYVVYLGGHSYADCKDDKDDGGAEEELDPELNIHAVDIEFDKEITSESFKLEIHYKSDSVDYVETVSFNKAADLTLTVTGTSGPGAPLKIDLSQASVDSKKEKTLLNIIFKNTDTDDPVTITDIGLSWDGGDKLDKQKIKKLTDLLTDVEHIKNSPNEFTKNPGENPWEAAGKWDACLLVQPAGFVIDKDTSTTAAASTGPVGCTDNDGCTPKNLAGVRYVLNTLFNIKYDLISREYVRSAPIVAHPWLYQGTFKYPSYLGHFRRFNVEADDPVADWDTGNGKIKDAKDGNLDTGSRKVYTAQYDAATDQWSKVSFDAANVDALVTELDVDPDNGDTADEIKVIERLRGRYWDYEAATPAFVEQTPNKLGGIMHSAPVIVRAGNSRVGSRAETAYVGDVHGMLHAIDTTSGIENWAYIPSNLLGKLKNDRTDPNAEADFAAVDGSPTAKDIYWDHDGDGDREWRTILVGAQGFGGNSIFALDVTDPNDWQVLWEATDDPNIGGEAPGGGMGYAFRAALDKVKVPALDVYGNPILDSFGNPTYTVKWMVFVATSFVDIAEDHGGINVFAFDLKTGTEQWTFSSTYADSVNDIPGAVTTFDINDDTLADRLYVGDMNGRMWELGLTDDPLGNWVAGDSVHIYGGKDDPKKDLKKGMDIPLFNAGIGNPISVSPAIIKRNGHVMLVFGTGGADWASDSQGYHVYAVDATAAGDLGQKDKNDNAKDFGAAIDALWSLPTADGEKVWSSPTISAGQIWVVTTFGTMESDDPKADKSGYSNLRVLDLGTGQNIWDDPLQIGKVRGSVYVSRKHVYMTAFNGDIIQLGHQTDFSAGTGNRVILKSWLQE